MRPLRIGLFAALLATSVSAMAGTPNLASLTRFAYQDPWLPDIERFEAEDAKNPPAKGGIVFIGSSSIALWRTLKDDFAGYNVINRGFGGSQLADSVRFAHRIVTPYEPKMVVLFAGTNDIAEGKTAETVLADYRAFVAKVREKLPATRIAYISISPTPSRWNKIEEVRKANRLIREYTLQESNLAFIDVFSYMLDANGGPRPELFVEDRLHLNPVGYGIWKKVVGPYLPWGG